MLVGVVCAFFATQKYRFHRKYLNYVKNITICKLKPLVKQKLSAAELLCKLTGRECHTNA